MKAITVVLDASVTLSWLLGRTDADENQMSDQLLELAHGSNNAVPPIWYPEIANGALRAARGQHITADQLNTFTRLLTRLPIFSDSITGIAQISRIYQLARTHALSAYDASYLDLALRHQASLATFDRKLADAARASGVNVLGHPQGLAEPLAQYA